MRFVPAKLVLLCFALFAFVSSALADIVDVGVARDAQVVENIPGTNYGAGKNMYVASANGGTFKNERAWLAFDLTKQLPPGATINSAKLRVYLFKADAANNLPVAAVGAGSGWTETGLNWSNQTAIDTTAQSTVTLLAGQENKWVEFDVTTLVQAHYSSDQIVSVVLKAVNEGAATWVSYAFDTREYSSVLAPRLRIDYTGAWPTANGFTIFHMNDAHSRVTPHEMDIPGHNNNATNFQMVGGAAHFSGKLLAMKSSTPNSLVLDAGDVSEGNPLGDLRSEGGMVDFYNLLDAKLKALPGGRGIDASVIGNHDIRSLGSLNTLKNLATYPVISANVVLKGTKTPFTKAYQVVTVNGKKVGILGFTNDADQPGADAAGTVEVLKAAWETADANVVSIKDYVNTLRTTEGVDVVVLLSHVGHTRVVAGSGCNASGVCDTEPLIEDHGGVRPPEVVVAGHWHSWAETAWQPAHLNYKTSIVEAASYLEYLGQLNVSGDGKYLSATKYPIINSQITPDADVQTLVNNLKVEFAATNPAHALDRVIGYSAVDLRLDKGKWWSMDEYPWNGNNTSGSWISDSMQWKANQLGKPTDLALQSGGGVRRDVPKGPVTYLQIYETYPWADDTMEYIQMTGQEIWDFIEGKNVGAAISKGWLVTANNGIVTSIKYNGTEIGKTTNYNVVVSNYMALHEALLQGKPRTSINYSIRESVVDYTGQFTQASPMTVPMPRYNLNTEMGGGFKAVVTMLDDSETQPYFQSAYIRLLEATPETVARRNSYVNNEAGHEKSYGLPGLIDSTGVINKDHPLAEMMLYRSQLAFPVGKGIKVGDIVELWGEATGFEGTPEFVDQEGIQEDGTEFKILGHDDALAAPEYKATISAFWDDAHLNHYVKFYAKKTGNSSVVDSAGTSIATLYQAGGYYSYALPGNVGDVLEITGVQTYKGGRRFRVASARVAPTVGFPPQSTVNAITPNPVQTGPITLAATASDAATGGSMTVGAAPIADAQVASGNPGTNYGTKTYLYVQSAASGFGNERSWLSFNLAGKVPAGATITGARLKLFNWKAGATGMPVALHATNGSAWTESGLTWANQPAYEASALDTQTVANINTWYAWNIGSYVSSQLGAGNTAVSFVLKPVTESAATTLTYAFESREYSANQPVLEIDYTVPAVTGTVTSVSFYSRYAADGHTWGPWTLSSTDNAAPWQTSYAFPQGKGYYEFYSIAKDNDNNVQPTPVYATAAVEYAPLTQQTISFAALPNHVIGDSFGLSATASSGLAVSFSSLTPSVCTVSGSVVSAVATGACTVAANQAGNATYAAAAQVTQAFQVLAFQVITFDPLADMQLNASPFTLSASASSGLAVSFASATTSICSVSGNSVTLLAVGTCTIVASQPGNGTYGAASQVSRSFAVLAATGSTDGDVPIPGWALAALGVSLVAGLRKHRAAK